MFTEVWESSVHQTSSFGSLFQARWIRVAEDKLAICIFKTAQFILKKCSENKPGIVSKYHEIFFGPKALTWKVVLVLSILDIIDGQAVTHSPDHMR